MADTVSGDRPNFAGNWEGVFSWRRRNTQTGTAFDVVADAGRKLRGASTYDAEDGRPSFNVELSLRKAGPELPRALLRGTFSAWVPEAVPPRVTGVLRLLVASGERYVGVARFRHRGVEATATVQLTRVESNDSPTTTTDVDTEVLDAE